MANKATGDCPPSKMKRVEGPPGNDDGPNGVTIPEVPCEDVTMTYCKVPEYVELDINMDDYSVASLVSALPIFSKHGRLFVLRSRLGSSWNIVVFGRKTPHFQSQAWRPHNRFISPLGKSSPGAPSSTHPSSNLLGLLVQRKIFFTNMEVVRSSMSIPPSPN